MKKLATILTLALLISGTASAQAATKVKLSPQFKVSKKDQLLTMTFSSLPKDHGIYVMQCMAPKTPGTAPTSCNPSENGKAWVSNVPADIAQGAQSGKGKVTMKVDKYFKGGDCLHTTCVIFVTNDHNASKDRSEDQAIPFKFGGLSLF
jgi:hypothetical protein